MRPPVRCTDSPDSSLLSETLTPPSIHPFLTHLLGMAEPLMASPADSAAWERIISDAADHNLTLTLYRWLNESGMSSELPPALLDRLKASAASLVARNLVLAQELAAVLQAFRQQDVPCIPIRGLALAEELYGDISARPMGDLDLLVRREALSEVAAVLEGLGFREIDRRPGFARTFSYTLEFVKDSHGTVLVEPHWSIAYPPFVERVDMDQIWKRCHRGTVAGVATWLLSSTDLLLHLSFHLIHKGNKAPLLWFYELHRLLQQKTAEMDWPQITLIAHQTGQSLFLVEVLRDLRHLFNSPIPPSVLSQLTAKHSHSLCVHGIAPLERRLARFLTSDSLVDGRESFAQLFAIRGFRLKIRFVLALLFPSLAFMRFHYGLSGRGHLALSYAARLLFLAREGCKGLVSLFTSGRKPLPPLLM